MDEREMSEMHITMAREYKDELRKIVNGWDD